MEVLLLPVFGTQPYVRVANLPGEQKMPYRTIHALLGAKMAEEAHQTCGKVLAGGCAAMRCACMRAASQTSSSTGTPINAVPVKNVA